VKTPKLDALSPLQRRQFLKGLGAALTAWGAPVSLQLACAELVGGVAHAAGLAKPTYFIEVNLRDQWDHGHVFVAPSLAKATNLKRGTAGDAAALYYSSNELQRNVVNGTEVFLTRDSLSLQPHLDTIAMIDTCEVGQGEIHGHEAANPVRSPGRTYERTKTASQTAMFSNERGANHPQGCEAFYSSTPTPASLHNYLSKQLNPGKKNGVVFKGIGGGLHTVYHFAAGLPSAELDRKQSAQQLFDAFPSTLRDVNILSRPELADTLTEIVKRVDARFLSSQRVATAGQLSHQAMLSETRSQLYAGAPKTTSLPLSQAERDYWSPGIPAARSRGTAKAQIWEQFAWAHKLVSNDLVKTVALEFDYEDYHGLRNEDLTRTMAQQCALPLARLITSLKLSGIYDQTLIAVFTTDGSREVRADSTGDFGKNSVILAGGMIRGGYFGDIKVESNTSTGHRFSYHRPDAVTGAPISVGVVDRNNDLRISGASMWRTIAKAMGAPDSEASRFPDVATAQPLPFVLR
jgi:hypothetical protein